MIMDEIKELEYFQFKFKSDNAKILDCMSGDDGGIKFFEYLTKMRHLSKLADSGDDSAIQICKIVSNFAQLIDTLSIC